TATDRRPSSRTRPARRHRSSPPAARTAEHPRRGRTPDPPTTSAEPPETRTLGQTTGGTGASPEQFADHRPDQAQLTTRDNALAETINGLYKTELLYRHIWRTRQEAELAIFRWIEGWYNPRRIQA